MKIFTLSLLLAVTACAPSEKTPRHVVDTVEVKVPVLERASAPKELYRSKLSGDELPLWIAPSDPRATVCVAHPGEVRLKRLLLRSESLLDGWEAYGR